MATEKTGILEVRVDGLEKDITEIKQDLRETKQDIKQSHAFFQQTISELKENLAVLSVIAKKQDEKIDVIHEELSYSRRDLSNNGNLPWYQKVLEHNNKWLLLLLLLTICLSFGIDITKLFGVFK